MQLGNALQKVGFASDEMQAIRHDNALRLFPRFQTQPITLREHPN